jgi:hypothetical protein
MCDDTTTSAKCAQAVTLVGVAGRIIARMPGYAHPT